MVESQEQSCCGDCLQKIEAKEEVYRHPRTAKILCHDCALVSRLKETWQPMYGAGSTLQMYVVKDKKAWPLRYLYPREPVSDQDETPRKEIRNTR